MTGRHRPAPSRVHHPNPRKLIASTPVLPRDPQAQELAADDSTIPGAGKGIFALRKYSKGDIICEYTGREVPLEEVKSPEFLTTVAYQISSTMCIVPQEIGSDVITCLGAYINDPLDQTRDNCELTTRAGKALIVATQNIQLFQELFLPYGPDYWNDPQWPSPLIAAVKRRYDDADAYSLFNPLPPADRRPRRRKKVDSLSASALFLDTG
jgi:hypothetical protein